MSAGAPLAREYVDEVSAHPGKKKTPLQNTAEQPVDHEGRQHLCDFTGKWLKRIVSLEITFRARMSGYFTVLVTDLQMQGST